MSPSEIVDLVTRRNFRAAVTAIKEEGNEGVSEEFFSRVAGLMGTSPTTARTVASQWRWFLKHGNEPGLAYRAKGALERLDGNWEAAARSFERAGAASSGLNRQRWAIGAVDSWARAGHTKRAISLGQTLVDELSQSDPLAAARCRINLANAMLWADNNVGAVQVLKAAIPVLQQEGAASELAAASLALSSAALECALPDEAATGASAAREAFEALGHFHHARLSALNLARCSLLVGQPDAALKQFVDLREQFQDSPSDLARIHEFCGDCLLALQRPDEALQAYEDGVALPAIRRMPLNHAGCWMGIAEASFVRGEPSLALQACRRAKRLFERCNDELYAAEAVLLQARAQLRMGAQQTAKRNLEAARRVFRSQRAKHQEVEALTALLEIEPQSTHLQTRARRLIRSGYGTRFEWKIDWVIARGLPSGPTRLRILRRMVESIVRSRLRLESSTGRMGFLKDKAEALQLLADAILERPTPQRVAEVIEVIRRTQAATLADELASTRHDLFSPETIAELETLRRSMAATDASPGTRGMSSTIFQARRSWVEAAVRLESKLEQAATVVAPSTLIYVAGRETTYRVSGQRSTRVQRSNDQLSDDLDWIEFDLAGPRASQSNLSSGFDERLRTLREALDVKPSTVVCPSPNLWRVPWALIGGEGQTPCLALGPGFSGNGNGWKLPASPRVAVWRGAGESLPHIEREVERLADLYQNVAVCDSVEAARESLGSTWDVLHISAHATFHRSNPMFSSFTFRDGELTALEIARSRGSVGLAVVGACDSGAMSIELLHEPAGFARAFLACGAAAVVASQWAVEDQAAMETLVPMHNLLVEGNSLGLALAGARAQCRSHFPHPFYWGPFIVFGGYSCD